MSRIKTFQTVHDPLTFPYFKTLEFYDDFENIGFVSVSLSQRKALPDFHMKYNVYNGIDLDRWKFNPQGGDKFCWSGRVIPEKGTHRAIEIAQKTGAEMHMAGFVYDGDKNNPDSYWNQKVRPLLGDKIRLDYVPKEKLSDFYGNSKAFINTLEWEEPFGLVMIEAMACGTPVIAFNRGSVKEIVKDGVTGFVVDNEDEMIEAVKNIGSISREACRKHVEENFSIKKMVDSYIEIYKEFINR